jgi:L-threonylcarbamoyladenylate synthase
MFFFSSEQKGAGQKCAELLKKEGCVLLVPTETVYGLVCAWDDRTARQNIYQLKHRSPAKLFAAFVPDLSVAEILCGRTLPLNARKLAEKFMPGPLTLIVKKEDGSTVGFRIPDHPQLLALLREVGEPLFQTSANRSGSPNALSCAEAVEMLCGTADAVADGGDIPADALASTIVDCTGEYPVIIRQGGLNLDEFLQSLR